MSMGDSERLPYSLTFKEDEENLVPVKMPGGGRERLYGEMSRACNFGGNGRDRQLSVSANDAV